jgi:cell division protease FtsH
MVGSDLANVVLGKIEVALGGRVAEELVFDDITTCPERHQAGHRAGAQHVRAGGMSDAIGPVTVITEDGPMRLPGASDVSPATQQLVDEEVHRLTENADEHVTRLMSANRRQARRAGAGAA